MDKETGALAAAIHQLSEAWRKKLTDTGRRNTALYFRHLKAGTLRVPDLNTDGILALVDTDTPLELSNAVVDDPDFRKRISTIRSKAKENEEERGIQTMFLAIGMASWTASDGGKNPKAPVFLMPVSISERARRVTLTPTGDLVVNRVMIQAWEEDHQHKPAILDNDDLAEIDLLTAIDQIAKAGQALAGFSISSECYLGNFSFAKMAMVEDLGRNEALLALNRLICAIAGDRDAKDAILNDGGTIPREELDQIDPFDEVMVLEADEYQRQAIHSLVRFGADGVVDGPPGTGKSQTIANLIAALVASGKRVLFVAEKRAALDAVLNRLTIAGLQDIVLDLHGADARRKVVYDRLRLRNDRARIAESPPASTPMKNLKAVRGKLNAYYSAVNRTIEGCGLTVREIIARLNKLNPEAEAQCIWYDNLESRTAELHNDARTAIAKLSASPDLFRQTDGVPWSKANLTSSAEATEALRFVTESRYKILKIQKSLEGVCRIADRSLITFGDLQWTCDIVSELYTIRESLSDAVVRLDPHALLRDIEPVKKGLIARAWAFLADPKYRKGLKLLRGCSLSVATPDLALMEGLERFAALPTQLRTASAFSEVTKTLAEDLRKQWSEVRKIEKTLMTLAGEVLPRAIDAATKHLISLEAAHRDARRIHDVRAAEGFLIEHDYRSLNDELKTTGIGPDLWLDMADNAWLKSFLERAKADEPMLGAFSRNQFEKLRSEFQSLDGKELERSRVVVRRGAGNAYVQAMNEKRDQALIFKAELLKKTRNLPIRRLVEKAGDIMTALCPCWMASPLSVSQLLPGATLFDVVIFDEASQVMPEDAIPAIMRANRAIVAGDQKQLPPTSFFASGTSDTEEDDEDADDDSDLLRVDLDGMESILDVMLTFCNRQSLNVHYRSLDEALIRFSNHEFYHDRLITFPNAIEGSSGVTHTLVEGPRNDGEELSSSAEIRKVVELVFEHAENRPSETLGVIALGIKHARRIEAAVTRERLLRPDLDEFFARDGVNESFFIKNLERVQGDERDAIILSFGYAKDGTGNLRNRLGPINHAGGERRLNVAVTRAKMRIHVVSSFTETDMDAARFSRPGAQVLCRYLGFARSGGTRLDGAQAEEVEMNEFERDVMDTLSSRGLRLVPQLGVSKYRLDFAALHPTIPNKYVLAIECDGAPYHSSATARDRDRLRQTHLENRGWRFHRIWSLDWHEQRADEIDRAVAAYAQAVAQSDVSASTASPTQLAEEVQSRPAGPQKRGRLPRIAGSPNIQNISESDIWRIFDWVCSDGILRSDDEIIAEAVPNLGFARRGRAIDDRLQRSVRQWRRTR